MRAHSCAAAALLIAACRSAAPEAEPWSAERQRVGDTTMVRTVSGSTWQRERRLAEVRELAPEADAGFREVTGLGLGASGDVVVYDGRRRSLSLFGPGGEEVLSVGGESAPVESDGGVAVLGDGRVVVREPARSRLAVYSRSGHLAGEWPLGSEIRTERPLYTDAQGNIYSLGRLGGRSVSPLEALLKDGGGFDALVKYGSDGVVLDTVPVPALEQPERALVATRGGLRMEVPLPYVAVPAWTFSPRGYFVSGPGADYVLDLHVDADSVLRIARTVERTAVTARELNAERERITAEFRDYFPEWQWPDTVHVPATKPAYVELIAGSDGRIWVQRSGRSDIAGSDDPVVYDVFDDVGTYLGVVRTPAGFRTTPQPLISGDTVVASVEEDGRKRVVVFVVRE